MSPNIDDARIDGAAIFVAAAFLVALIAVAALDRVGAPAPLVRALGPVVVLALSAGVGLATRNADLGRFLAARRGVPPRYGALHLVATAAGATLALDPAFMTPADPPWLGLALGLAVAGLVVGPLARRFAAAGLADVVATRFSRSGVRALFALVMLLAATLTAYAGFEIAMTVVRSMVASAPALAAALVALALVAGGAPGGAASMAWNGAAAGGALLLLAAFADAVGWRFGLAAPDPQAFVASAASAFAGPDAFAPVLATALAFGGFFAFASPATTSPNAGGAAKAGFAGLVLAGLLFAGVVAAAAVFPLDLRPGVAAPAVASLVGAAMLAAGLTLARAGALGASRALGVALADPPRPYPTLASVRLARMRGVQVAVIALCAFVDVGGGPSPRTALVVAMTLSLAFGAPALLLAAVPRVGPIAASLGMVGGLAAAYRGALTMTRLPHPTDLFEQALAAAAAAFVVGALASLVLPRRGPAPTPGDFDPFADPSG